eukprot:Lithocolla_globosa_v1_NODE_1459_length_2559_cov_27.905351.p1 type:complete len:640 gc:universal NODE_1459_length_2559_cov_27.905351:511-2430(+)
MEQFSPISQKHIPYKSTNIPTQSKHKARKPWITQELKKRIKKQQKLYEQAQIKQEIELRKEHHIFRNKLRKDLSKAKKTYYNQLFEKHRNNANKTWGIIKNILNPSRKSQSHPKQINSTGHDGTKIKLTGEKEIANEFNNFFTSVASKLVEKIQAKKPRQFERGTKFTDYLTPNLNSCFRFQKTTPKVEELLNKLDKGKSVGVDHIHPRTIIDAADILAPLISHVFNLCIKIGVFPRDLKPARVTPIHKRDNPFEASNYRPISILTTLSKIFERIILNQLMVFMLENKIITNAQYGFLKKISTKTALLDFYEDLLQNLDKKDVFGLGVLIDLAKAFDTVNHKILLEKLAIYGVGGMALQLLSSYLLNRSQIVIIDGVASNPMNISCGVPQGSILGPFLFILYINDLPNVMKHSKTTMFADDTTLTIFNRDILKLRQSCLNDLSALSLWCDLNLLTLNASKTHYLLFSSPNKMIPDDFPSDNLPSYIPKTEMKQTSKTEGAYNNKTTSTTTTETTFNSLSKTTITTPVTIKTNGNQINLAPRSSTTDSNPMNITLGESPIEMTAATKFLGIMIDENAKWAEHIKLIIKKLNKYIGLFSKLRHIFPTKVMKNLYFTFIYPHYIVLKYGEVKIQKKPIYNHS